MIAARSLIRRRWGLAASPAFLFPPLPYEHVRAAPSRPEAVPVLLVEKRGRLLPHRARAEQGTLLRRLPELSRHRPGEGDDGEGAGRLEPSDPSSAVRVGQ